LPTVQWDSVAQGFSAIDAIPVAPALLPDRDVTGLLQVFHDFLHGAFCDAYILRNVAQPGFSIPCQANQYVAVVAEESPIAHHMTSHVAAREREGREVYR
jgi:hypothetical protein